MTSFRNRPLLLHPVESKKSWGTELWLNAARPEAPAKLHVEDRSLAQAIASDPAILGAWSRRLFGDELPIFTKVIRADFPPLVHVGFRSAIHREQLVSWLEAEQKHLRALFALLVVPTKEAFDGFARAYSRWATSQAEAQWQRDDDEAFGRSLAPFLRGAFSVKALRENRAAFVSSLNEVDLRAEAGNMLVTSAGILHAIFGLSHQTHPLDATRAPLQALFTELEGKQSLTDEQMFAIADALDLHGTRAGHAAPPKNEAWMPFVLDGGVALVEPQQSSDTTYSVADFYTPFVWSGDRARFRKGDPAQGISTADLEEQLAGVELAPTSLASIRRSPIAIETQPGATRSVIVDEPTTWPFFTAHQIDLTGGTLHGDHAHGVFQQIVVVEGAMTIAAGGHSHALDDKTPVFIPATMTGGYTLSGEGRALVLSVPSPRE